LSERAAKGAQTMVPQWPGDPAGGGDPYSMAAYSRPNTFLKVSNDLVGDLAVNIRAVCSAVRHDLFSGIM